MDNLNESIIRLVKLPDLVTLVNALLGFTAILMVVQSPSNVYSASVVIMLAVMADSIDGAIARNLEFGVLGKNLDALADVISFGVAPAVIAYAILAPQYHTLICMVGGAFLAGGILRLARFNSITHENGFSGLPITTTGLILPLYILLFYDIYHWIFGYGLLFIMFAMTVLMVSTIPYPKIRNIRIITGTAALLGLTILLFYLNNPLWVRITSGINLMIIGLYIFSPALTKKKTII